MDELIALEVIVRFQESTGIDIDLVGDTEAGKTTGLIQRLLAEADAGRPRADVFWSSEPFGTILLARRDVLEPYEPPTATDLPAEFRSADGRWTAVAARARVLAFDPERIDESRLPSSWAQLAEPEWAGQLAMGNPLFGTTRGHVAGMFALWGELRTREFLTALRDGGTLVLDGNSAAVRAVMSGRMTMAATDTDDVWFAKRNGASLEMRYLDMGHGGTLIVPCTVGLVRGGPNPSGGRRLIDFLVSEEAERLLAESHSRNVPVRPGLRAALHMEWPAGASVSMERVADELDKADATVREILIR